MVLRGRREEGLGEFCWDLLSTPHTEKQPKGPSAGQAQVGCWEHWHRECSKQLCTTSAERITMFTKLHKETWQLQSHQCCPHMGAKKQFPHNKHIDFITRGTSLHYIDQVSGNPHMSFSWFQSHSLLSDLLPLYILLVILTENGKYTSLMAYLFTRDM